MYIFNYVKVSSDPKIRLNICGKLNVKVSA
jgi:hypothetical protein